MFTTRPEIQGTFGVVATTHWIASSVGMAMLERGGNAFDACVAAGFVLQIVEPHLCGPGGDMPAVFHSTRTGRTEVLCAQGPAPAGATIARYKAAGLDQIPGSGLLATVIPGAFDGWMLLLKEHGTLSLRDVLEPAIHYAASGHPMLPRVSDTIAGLADFFRAEWPTSFSTWLPNGAAPSPRALFRNPALAETYSRILSEAESGGGGRERQIEAARRSFYDGFVAEAIDRYVATTAVADASGARYRGVLTGQDLSSWRASFDAPATLDYHGYTVCKTGFWGSGPVMLQSLALLEGLDVGGLDPVGPEFIHAVVESMKLAFADREVFYGDPLFAAVPTETLLSKAYAAERRALISDRASHELRPGSLPGFEGQTDATFAALARLGGHRRGVGEGEPTFAGAAPPRREMERVEKRGDTVHIDAIDRWGNMISATPSGGWLQSSPVVPGLGFALNSRAQMFWLEEGLPTSLAPGKRPRTTLSPSLALKDGKPYMVFGTPGGDQQDQWQLPTFLRHVHHGMNLQEAIDLPLFHTSHFNSSFYPRDAHPGTIVVEESVGEACLAALERKGHIVQRAPAWSNGRLTAAAKGDDGVLRAAATPRLMQAYAVGR